MYKWYQVLAQDLDENVDEILKDLDENLAWLTQKSEDSKGIKGALRSSHTHTHTVNVIELNCKVIKSGNPPFEVYPLFLAKSFVPSPHSQVTQFLEGCPPISFNKGGGFQLYGC